MGYEEHPHYITPPDDTVVWRYMNFVKLVALLENARLWFARLDLLDDPREGGLTELELKQFQGTPPEVAEHNLRVFESLRRESFINCWTESHESMAMWDLYAQAPGSVAIKSTVGLLKRAIAGADPRIHIARVDYLDWKAATWPNNQIGMSVRKAWGFGHEKEARLISVLPGSSAPTEKEAGDLLKLVNVIRGPVKGCADTERHALERIFNYCWDRACLGVCRE